MTKEEKMFRIVERHARSGMSQHAYADSLGISRSTMQYWFGRYRRRNQDVEMGTASSFVELPPVSIPEQVCATRIIITLASGIRIEVL